MHQYILRRLLLMVPTLLGVTLLIFGMVRLLPGDTVTMMIQDFGGSEKTADEMRARLGIDQPFPVQYIAWLSKILRGDFGESLRNRTPISEDIAARIPVTLELGVIALLIALLISLPLGIYSAVKQDTLSDYISRSSAIAMLAVPSFWLGTLAITLPSIWWKWTPPLRYSQLSDDMGKNLTQMMLPAVILGIGLSGTIMRLTRTQMLEVLRQDYIRTAASKGLSQRFVLVHHALKNALIPIVTVLGLQVAVLVSGAVVLENIFALPGMGRYLLDAISNRDYPQVQAVTLIFAVLIIFANLFVDVLYAWLDPRIRYS